MKTIFIGLVEIFLVIYFVANILIGIAVNSTLPSAGDAYYIIAVFVLIIFLVFNYYLTRKRKLKDVTSDPTEKK